MRSALASGTKVRRIRLVVGGIVQGVGFRPFVHRLAGDLGLAGWVLNSTEGVVIEVEGLGERVESFVRRLRTEAPPRATMDRMEETRLPPAGYRSFAIEESRSNDTGIPMVSPDIAVCDECLTEMRDRADRRFGYPFTNCTSCGPRFTIVADTPYDRASTTMASFDMCGECEAEYHDVKSRRFHAQPNACPQCGPRVWFVPGRGRDGDKLHAESAIIEARRRLKRGEVVAVKGLGGFHLACDATSHSAVGALRDRKRRSGKPFAVMVPTADAASVFCDVTTEERQLLESPQRPIVLLRLRKGCTLSPQVAPGNHFLGVMLPYTPLHHLLFGDHQDGEPALGALVMTSGNLSDEPIATTNQAALQRLAALADGFLLHDRDILVPCDDSVARVFQGGESLIRRSRGYAPFPVRLGFDLGDVLACGGQLKATFCITRGDYAFLSQHIGDLENEETLRSLAESVEHFRKLFRLDMRAVAHDLHPEYLSTRFAWDVAAENQIPVAGVQHHHAHVASCMAENGIDQPVIGVAFDGTGYGEDGALWGGEFLVADYSWYRRAGHLKYMPLPGGEAAVRQPWRMAASYLLDSLGPDALRAELFPGHAAGEAELAIVHRQIARRINAPLTSSAGRLFDAVSSLLGMRQTVTYEGQAAIELEMASDPQAEGHYEWRLLPGPPIQVDMAPAFRQMSRDRSAGVGVETIAGRFHNTVACLIAEICGLLSGQTGISLVALSGGVFQNHFLLGKTTELLTERGLKPLVHRQVPANDGGIALGQAAIASRLLHL